MHSLSKHVLSNTSCLLCRLDPRTKLLSSVMAIITIVFLPENSYIGFGAITAWLFIAIIISHKSSVFYLRRLLKIYPMIFFMTLMLPFAKSGSASESQVIFSFGSIQVYSEGIYRFIDVNIRSVLIFTSSLVLVSETSFRGFLKTFSVLRTPKWIEAIMIYMQRFIYLTAAEFSRMHQAFSARSFNMGFFTKMKTVGKMSGVYLSRLIDRSERSHIAMISRGFSGEIYTRYQIKWQYIDSIIILVNGFFLLVILFGWF